MRYEMYLATTGEAAQVTGGDMESLAGGYYGVRVKGDGLTLMLALDMDDEDGWFCWSETPDGDHCCDYYSIRLGWVGLGDLADEGFNALLQHSCPVSTFQAGR